MDESKWNEQSAMSEDEKKAIIGGILTMNDLNTLKQMSDVSPEDYQAVLSGQMPLCDLQAKIASDMMDDDIFG